MSEYDKFEILVKTIAELAYHGELEDVGTFDTAINNAPNGRANFFAARSDWDGIDVVKNNIQNVRYYAEYYDGMQAPFLVCSWDDDFEKLEELLRNTSDILYNIYQKKLKED